MLLDLDNLDKTKISFPISSKECDFDILLNMKAILKHYDGFLFDIWGVIHDGIKAFPGVAALINALIAEDKKIIFLSNAPRPGSVLVQKLIDLGINLTSDMILSSGDVVRDQLINFNDAIFSEFKELGKCFFHLGAERNQDILSGLTVEVTEDIEHAHFVLLTAYVEEDEDLNQHDTVLKKALGLNLPLICANPDAVVSNGDKLRYCAGVLAEKYEKWGGRVHYYGKPCPAAFEKAIYILRQKGIHDQKKILMIGDTLETDILGAKNANLDSALVLTGNMGRVLENAQANIPQHLSFCSKNYLQTFFEVNSLFPTWILRSLA